MAGPPGRIVLNQPVDIARPRDRLGVPFQSLHHRLRVALDTVARHGEPAHALSHAAEI
jgi:hypothetical protein